MRTEVAELVEHDHLEPGKLSGQGPGLADPGLFLEPVHNVSLSTSGLLRLANRQLGFSPKTLVRRTRFLRAMTTLLMSHAAPDHSAVPAGYHDVPHFLRDADAFLGMTLRRFLALPLPYLRAVLRARTDVVGVPLPMLD